MATDSQAASVQPVGIVHRRDHEFVKHGRARRKGERCAVCGWAMMSTAGSATWQEKLGHRGAPQSLNVAGSGGNPIVYQNTKRAWSEMMAAHLEGSGLPRDLAAVSVECEIGFPTRTRRDEGNFRYMLEKALGDVLVAGGWLEDDSFYPERRYSFGNIEARHTPGESWTRLMLFPTSKEG